MELTFSLWVKRSLGLALINSLFFLPAMLFTDLTLLQCLLYSLINGAWMAGLLLPLLDKISEKIY